MNMKWYLFIDDIKLVAEIILRGIAVFSVAYLIIQISDQPERSKREDSQKCEMRCSEHCGNTVRESTIVPARIGS